jgi:cation:H+ antiporter
MSTTLAMLAAFAGLALLYGGGESLVRGAVALATRAGISRLAIGLTVVAFGTSAPELAVSVDAALADADDVALGNVIGSNICNVALILGLAALVRPAKVRSKVVRLDAPLVVAASLVLAAMLASGGLGRVEGVGLLAALAAYVALTLRQARGESKEMGEEFSGSLRRTRPGLAAGVLLVGGGMVAIVGGGHLLVGGAVQIARSAGVSEAVIGLSMVAVGTSLPELATSVVAAARGESDIAVGNVLGSNLFNILGILGVTATIEPLARGGVGWIDIGAMIGLSLLILPMLFTRSRLGRAEGTVLLIAYAAYLLALAWR